MSSSDQKLSPFGDAVAGSLGALFANLAVFPLDVIKTRLQVQSKSNIDHQYDHALDAFRKILEKEGVQGLYSGLGAGLFGTVAQNFAYFYWWSWIRGVYQAKIKGPTSTVAELSLGALAGALSQLCTLPIAVITTRQQTTAKAEKKSLAKTYQQIVKEEGYQGLWKGLRASLVLCVNPAITYGMFERLKTMWLQRQNRADGKLGSVEIFLIGAIAKTMATVVTYPYIMAKTNLQVKHAPIISKPTTTSSSSSAIENNLQNGTPPMYKGAIDVIVKVFESDGALGLYKGMQAQILKAVLCQALLFVTKEYFSTLTILLFATLSRRQRLHQLSVAKS